VREKGWQNCGSACIWGGRGLGMGMGGRIDRKKERADNKNPEQPPGRDRLVNYKNTILIMATEFQRLTRLW
jgi:hypothetical protein